jgi:Mrp family chromosome partitioning ATPase
MAINTGLLHLSDFFAVSDAAGTSAATQPLSPTPVHCLLSGPPRCGKTSLLFQLAYSLAARGASVLIIAKR